VNFSSHGSQPGKSDPVQKNIVLQLGKMPAVVFDTRIFPGKYRDVKNDKLLFPRKKWDVIFDKVLFLRKNSHVFLTIAQFTGA